MKSSLFLGGEKISRFKIQWELHRYLATPDDT